MQPAITATTANDSTASGATVPPHTLHNQFVINLCASTTPVALTPPDHAGLKRFTFFVSRRREEGRERFRLHMGYFETQEEAERLLDIVREIYPGAWAGLAPGQRLRAQAQAEALAQAQAQAQSELAAAVESAPVAASAPTNQIAATALPAPLAAPCADAAPREEPALTLLPDEGRRISEQPDAAPQHGSAPAHGQAAHENEAATNALRNVRAAIASLNDSTTIAPTLSPLPELKPVNPASAAHEAVSVLSASAALKVLEGRIDTASASTVSQPRLPLPASQSAPGQTAAANASATARPRDEKTAYAVQLLWSVQPIDIAQIPQLAIFSAYTLYGAEGNRDGRRWYGVRLGFFTDAVSAKQVAHYVRSDFSTVSVVPVTVRERERAKLAVARPDATPLAAASTAAAAPSAAPVGETKTGQAAFQFIEDKQPAPTVRGGTHGDAPGVRASRGAPGKRAKLRTGKQVNARSKSKPMTLEETLEILGAGHLQMDDGRRALINDDTARAPAREAGKEKSSRFGRLLERLSERLGS